LWNFSVLLSAFAVIQQSPALCVKQPTFTTNVNVLAAEEQQFTIAEGKR
jgi:hypothetical protein